MCTILKVNSTFGVEIAQCLFRWEYNVTSVLGLHSTAQGLILISRNIYTEMNVAANAESQCQIIQYENQLHYFYGY